MTVRADNDSEEDDEKKKKKKLKPIPIEPEVLIETPIKNELKIENFNIVRMPNEDEEEKTIELQLS